jgi:type 1 glutamine amidotransferase
MKGKRLIALFMFLQLVMVFDVVAQKQFKALLVTRTRGWQHESVHAGVLAIQQLAIKNNFEVSLWEDHNGFNDKFLEPFQVIIFLQTTGDIFDSAQQKVMERFIRSGKGFVGIHSASDTEYDWEWYTKLVGRMFYIHPVIQTAKLQVLDPAFPGLQGIANGALFTDEWYTFGPEKVNDLHYVLAVDESSYNPKVEWKASNKKSDGMGSLHPVSWYHNYDGGRSFYTALSHLPAIFSNSAFLDHLYGGIFWAATGKK